jgi:hypothetical protein
MTKETIVSNDIRILVVYNFAEVKKDSIYILLQQKLNDEVCSFLLNTRKTSVIKNSYR